MSNQRYDIEWASALIFTEYLKGIISSEIQTASPVITFFDPMAVDEADRIIVEIPNGKTMKESRGNFSAVCKVTVKSRWRKPSVSTDMAAHFDRVNWTRDALLNPALNDETTLAAIATTKNILGVAIQFQRPEISFSTDVREGWIYSEASFTFDGYIKE